MKNMIIVLVVLIFFSMAECSDMPQWLNSDQPIEKDMVSENDEAYLAGWIKENSAPAIDYLVNKCKEHQLVIIGEQHNIAEHKTIITDNIQRLYYEAGVRIIAWEFSRHADNNWLNDIVNLPLYDSLKVLNFARMQSAHEWNSREHWEMIKAVWEVNHSLNDDQEKMKLVGIDINEDLCEVVENMSKPTDSKEFQETMDIVKKRDLIMADHVIEDVMEPGKKGIVFVGRCHDYTHHQLAEDNPLSNYVMGNVIQQKYPDKVFQIWIYSGWFSLIEKLAERSELEMFAFDNYNSPFANILQETGWKFDTPAPFSNIARGVIYMKPLEKLHKNSTIPGFINEELFEKHNDFYKLNYGTEFKNAKELDSYIQKNRW